jgi:hypothetical protein
MRLWRVSLLLVTVLGLTWVLPASAQPAAPSLPANATAVASGLINPRGFTFAPDGALVVAESGAFPDGFEVPHGPPTPMFRPATTTTGRISRIDLNSGERTTIVDGLPSSASSFGDTLGPANVAYLGSDLYVLISAGPVHGWPNYASGVYKVNADGTVRLVGNLDAFNAKNPVALVPPDDEISNPYDMVAADGALWITVGNRNQVYKVTTDGTVSRVADMSQGHPVLTGIAVVPGGGIVTVELTAVPYVVGSGRVSKISATGETATVAKATTAATGVAVASNGTVYVVEHAESLGKPPFLAPVSGRLARLTADGTLETVAGGLNQPTIARVGPDGAVYVTNVSVDGDHGEGQIIRIDTAGGM